MFKIIQTTLLMILLSSCCNKTCQSLKESEKDLKELDIALKKNQKELDKLLRILKSGVLND